MAWAVAVIVVALVVGFLGYTWMTRDDAPQTSPQAPATSTPTATDEAPSRDAESDGETTESAPEETQAAQPSGTEETSNELTPEQEDFLLGLQRREADDPLALGAADAPVVIIEYADYRCPFCAAWSRDVKPDLMPFIEDGTVRLEYRDVILFGEESENAALGARAAGEQGMYWEFHDAVAAAAPESGHAPMPRERVLELASEVGVPDLEKFETDLDSDELRAAMAADQQEAASIGVRSTPTFLVNTTPVVGARDADIFELLIEQELADRR